jgi:mRNA interferase HigB
MEISIQRGSKSEFRSIIIELGRYFAGARQYKYGIVVWINYPYRVVYIRFIGTHRQYDTIDAQKV